MLQIPMVIVVENVIYPHSNQQNKRKRFGSLLTR
jgi:hypothetical protein